MGERGASSVEALSQATADGRDVPFVAVLAGAIDGAPWAFRRLFASFGPGLLAYGRGQGVEDPDGLANEVLLRAFRGVAAFDGTEAQFRSWIYTLAHNLVIDDRRRRSRRCAVVDLTDRALRVAGGDVEDDAFRDECGDDLDRRLSSLTAEQREVLLLRVGADLPVVDVARITGRSAVAVRALHHRALQALRRDLSV